MRRAELGVLALLVALGIAPLVAMLLHANADDLVFAGADGPFAGDQFQYFAWIREYGTSLLADNDLDLAPSDNVFLHPLFLLEGLAVRAGLSVELAFQLAKPLAIAVLFLGCRAYVRRFVTVPWQRVAALALALLFASPVVLVGGDDVLGAAGEMFPAALLWGYLPAAIAVGLMPVFLLGAERIAERARPRDVAAVAACGAVAAWLHPWQGQVLLVTLVAGLVVTHRPGRRYGALAVAAAATLAPILYYFVLSLADPSWEYAAEANEALGQAPLWAALVAVLPLAAVAAFGVRRPPWDLGEAMLLVWAPASLVVFAVASPSFPQHALEGIGIPLAVLAARGLARPALAAAVAALLIVPGTVWLLDWLRDTVEAPGQAHYLQRDEARALDHLDADGEPGGVLTSARLGTLVPSATGRRSWLGHPSWTRDYAGRARQVEELLAGRLPPDRAVALVQASGARFVLVECGRPPLRLPGASVQPFGCAAVHRVG